MGCSAAVANMAIDAALLDTLAADDSPILRFYRWPEPTLSLGYFQSSGDRRSHRDSEPLEMVRRGSGGGAIVHHHEWTYSLIMPSRLLSGISDSTDWMYRLVHDCFQRSLEQSGWLVRSHRDSGRCDGDCDAFLCFERRSEYDLTMSGYKILGSAQRRGRHGRLQHGSLVLRASEFAPQLPGIVELGGKGFDDNALLQTVSSMLASELRLEIVDQSSFGESVTEVSRALAAEKFGRPGWVERR